MVLFFPGCAARVVFQAIRRDAPFADGRRGFKD
jgi:hypothetical protein